MTVDGIQKLPTLGPSLPRRIINPFHLGFWLASNLYDFYEPAQSVPSWKWLAWNTRKVTPFQMKHWLSEPDVTAVPAVEVWLRTVRIAPYVGRQYNIWCTEVEIRLTNHGEVETFARRRAYGDYDEALDDFKGHGHRLRWWLTTPRQRRPDESTIRLAR